MKLLQYDILVLVSWTIWLPHDFRILAIRVHARDQDHHGNRLLRVMTSRVRMLHSSTTRNKCHVRKANAWMWKKFAKGVDSTNNYFTCAKVWKVVTVLGSSFLLVKERVVMVLFCLILILRECAGTASTAGAQIANLPRL